MVGGPGFEPGASRSRTGTLLCPRMSLRFLTCPLVLVSRARRVLWCPSVSSWFRESVTRLWHGDAQTDTNSRVYDLPGF